MLYYRWNVNDASDVRATVTDIDTYFQFVCHNASSTSSNRSLIWRESSRPAVFTASWNIT